MQVDAADIQDRDGAPEVLASIRYLFPWLRHVFPDGAYAGQKLETALLGHGQWTLEVVKRSDQTKGFQVLPRRWVVERTLTWLGRKPAAGQGFRENHRQQRGMALPCFRAVAGAAHGFARLQLIHVDEHL